MTNLEAAIKRLEKQPRGCYECFGACEECWEARMTVIAAARRCAQAEADWRECDRERVEILAANDGLAAERDEARELYRETEEKYCRVLTERDAWKAKAERLAAALRGIAADNVHDPMDYARDALVEVEG